MDINLQQTPVLRELFHYLPVDATLSGESAAWKYEEFERVAHDYELTEAEREIIRKLADDFPDFMLSGWLK